MTFKDKRATILFFLVVITLLMIGLTGWMTMQYWKDQKSETDCIKSCPSPTYVGWDYITHECMCKNNGKETS